MFENVMLDYLKRINDCFVNCSDNLVAQQRAGLILNEAALDRNFLFDVIKSNFDNPQFLRQKRDYSRLLKFYIRESPHYSFVMNIFPPNPFNSIPTSVKSIHHHRNLLLTTVTAYGDGYETILFKDSFEIHPDKSVTLKIDRIFNQRLFESTFIDKLTPHVVFFPATLTATYSLWCLDKKRKIDSLKRFPIMKYLKQPLNRLLSGQVVGRILGLNDVREVYYYVEDKKIRTIEKKIGYEKGTVRNNIFNILSFLYQVGFDDFSFLKSIAEKDNTTDEARNEILRFIHSPSTFEKFNKIHQFIPEENIPKSDILAAIV